MSAGTLENTRAGHTAISAGTLQRLVAAIAADAFKVPMNQVRAGVRDGQGQLSVSLALALATVPLSELAGSARAGVDQAVFSRAATARETIVRRVQDLSGSSVGQVDIRFTGVHVENRERVQ
ncbi:hypothetical protein CVV68_00945 [Arthrobacter livingstonensis]|uniref:Asp23/Gls24 family envelope stress response protein n=1 Tax=Arthrobacter livingstonensis TaxID=670078 RepID=A0A2V5M2K2_9MICC|nr:hypothetical protein [Arthrobacter livingstonensis]PYI69706.1 hypothetical protein CVV68_00945 [Arthrobacter livingstonensis]